MSAKLIKIRTIIDFFLLNSNLSRELLIKRINKLIKIHNTQVKQGRFHEDAMEYISTAEQLIFLKNTKKRVYEFFEGTEYEDIIKARYRERGNYNYIAYELHMSQGKYYYMMNKVYSFFYGKPDEILGQKICAVVQPLNAGIVTAEYVMDLCRKQLPEFMQCNKIEIIENFKIGVTGKK